jgi:hypothetical protein
MTKGLQEWEYVFVSGLYNTLFILTGVYWDYIDVDSILYKLVTSLMSSGDKRKYGGK